jgi:hypothetical protein
LVGVVLDMLMGILSEVGFKVGFVNWDILFLPFFAAEEEVNILVMPFLFHRGVQTTPLDVDVDDDSGVISVVGGVLCLLVGDVDGCGLPDAPPARSR